MIESAFPILEVDDMPAALAFYRDALGGAVAYRFPLDGDPDYVSLAVGTSSLGIGLTEAPRPPGNMLLWFYVDDVDRMTATLADAGATVEEEPLDQPWGDSSPTRSALASASVRRSRRRPTRSRRGRRPPWCDHVSGAPASAVRPLQAGSSTRISTGVRSTNPSRS
jgi:uncharacterized glyoxalase superfamily protein PhnB